MSPLARSSKGGPKQQNSTDVIANIQDLIVHLHRGNSAQAESIVKDVLTRLRAIASDADLESFDRKRAQQTTFAIDEVRILLSERDFEGAAKAARDAANEWRQKPAL